MFENFASVVSEKKPEILLGLGIFGVAVAIGETIRATVKARDILEEMEEELEAIRESAEEVDEEGNVVKVVDDKTLGKIITRTYIKYGVRIGFRYLLMLIILILAILALLSSYQDLNEQRLGLASALSATNVAFAEYRSRVRDEVGAETEQMLYDGGHKETISVTTFDGKGKEKTEEIEEIVYSQKPADAYTILFDAGNKNWEKDGERNWNFIKTQQDFAQAKLDARGRNGVGWLTLNEAFELLDHTPTKAGCIMGWPAFDENGNRTIIDFGCNGHRLDDLKKGKVLDAYLTFNVSPKPVYQYMDDYSVPKLA